MLYVMFQQVKKKRLVIMEWFFVNLLVWILFFVRVNYRCCFIEYVVDEFMVVFCVE